MSELSKLAREYNCKIGQVHMALGCIRVMPDHASNAVKVRAKGIEMSLWDLKLDLKRDYESRKKRMRSRQKEMEES